MEKKFSGKLEKIMLDVCDAIINRGLYFAEQFEKTMSGIGMNQEKFNALLIRCRYNQELAMVKAAYLEKYGKSLEKRVKGETSGDHEKLAVALISI